VSAPGARIRLEQAAFAYHGASEWAFSGLNLDVGRGEELWVTGGNAAGKSTLLGVLAGVMPETIDGVVSGSVDVVCPDGATAVPAMVMQDSGVYLFRSVSEEISFVLLNRGVEPEQVESGVVEALAVLDVEHLTGRLMHTLSGGERQKVAVAASLAVEPDLLLLDEPFEQLDPASVAETFEIARGLRESGVTLVVATREHERVPRHVRELHLESGRPAERPTARDVPVPRTACIPGAPLLEMGGVSFHYDGGAGFTSVDLTVREGESVALLGPNGAGKTTLMKHANGLLRPSEGSVAVRGHDIAERPVWDLARDVGLLFQNPDDQIFNRRVDAEVAWSLAARGMPEDDALARASEAMEELGIAHLASENPHEITASQRQLVAFASVLVTRPALYVLDEPTKALDKTAAEVVAEAVDRRLADGAGVLLVTHDLSFARRLSDRAVVLAEGSALAEGPTLDLLADDLLMRRARLLS
jgi:energy-coupling factor transport system ATP-binding protein